MHLCRRLRHVFIVLGLLSLQGAVLAQDLVVSAAASLTQAFEALAKAYEQTHPGQRVRLNFGASGALLAQVQHGAPVDVLATADMATMDRAQASGHITPDTRVNFARNELVLLVSAQRVDIPTSLQELKAPGIRRIAAGSPASVPAGRYAQLAIEHAGLSPDLRAKWIYGESVRQVLDYVARGEVDAGFVYRTDALARAQLTRIALSVPTPEPVRYPIAQVKHSRRAAQARAFIHFIQSEPGQAVLRRFGFLAP